MFMNIETCRGRGGEREEERKGGRKGEGGREREGGRGGYEGEGDVRRMCN